MQVAATSLLLLFIIPVLLRKRCVTLIRILDYVQMAALFKLVRGYTDGRQTWVYLGLRGWGMWEEGWQIFDTDQTVPVWINDEGVLDKAVRVGSFTGLFIIFSILFGVVRSALDEKNMTFEKYMKANIGNLVSFAFYYTLQDTSFVAATVLLNPSFSSKTHIIGFGVGLFFVVLIIAMMAWSFNIINYPTHKYHHYKYFFLSALDYDHFPTYSLLDLPKSSKQIKKYSNLRIVDMIKKIGFSFLMVGFLSSSRFAAYSTADQLYQIAAYIAFF